MATPADLTPAQRKALSHTERTATEPRDPTLHLVLLKQINQINPSIRLLRFSPSPEERSWTFLPGQWLDVFVPGIPKAGGFTITSAPSLLSRQRWNGNGYFELAIQKSPKNPPAAWLWRAEKEILGEQLRVRVGGSFTWPPKFYGGEGGIKRVVFVAGGVGINPLMSMVSHLSEQNDLPFEVKFLFSVRDPGAERRGKEILFLDRLVTIFKRLKRGEIELFLTGGDEKEGAIGCDGGEIGFKGRRITQVDLERALGRPEERAGTVVYICGVPAMTDGFVKAAQEAEGIDPRHVLCEKWW